MAGLKKVMNWFVTIEPDEGDTDIPREAADPDPDVAAKAARERAEKGPVGRQPDNLKVGQARRSGAPMTLAEELAAEDARLAAEQGGASAGGGGDGFSMEELEAELAQKKRSRGSFGESGAGGSINEQMSGGGLGGSGALQAPMSPEEIFTQHGLGGPQDGFNVYKVQQLLKSQYLATANDEVKRASLLVAMEASGVTPGDVLGDARDRDHALDSYDSMLQSEIEELELQVQAENEEIQAEVNRLLEEMRQKVAANNERLAEGREAYQQWKLRKQEAEEELFRSISLLVEPGHRNPVTRED